MIQKSHNTTCAPKHTKKTHYRGAQRRQFFNFHPRWAILYWRPPNSQPFSISKMLCRAAIVRTTPTYPHFQTGQWRIFGLPRPLVYYLLKDPQRYIYTRKRLRIAPIKIVTEKSPSKYNVDLNGGHPLGFKPNRSAQISETHKETTSRQNMAIQQIEGIWTWNSPHPGFVRKNKHFRREDNAKEWEITPAFEKKKTICQVHYLRPQTQFWWTKPKSYPQWKRTTFL